MKLQRVEIQNVRNLTRIIVNPSDKLNILCGNNASGKTSFLEALHLLSYGKSFRTRYVSKIVAAGAEQLTILGKLGSSDRNDVSIGIGYQNKKFKIRVAGQSLKKTSELAQYLPLTIIHQDSYRLLSDGPRFRKQFLDRGVFHVEQTFLLAWNRYRRALKQRNSSLQKREALKMAQIWNIELSDTAKQLHFLRSKYIEEFLVIFQSHVERLLGIKESITIKYQAGWQVERDYSETLDEAFERDRAVGYTRKGPHRADLDFRVNGVPVHEYFSRGQQKLLVSALMVAQADVYRQRKGSSGLLLIDDLDAELDKEHVEIFLAMIDEIEAQVFVTTTNKNLLATHKTNGYKLFHVEHGCIEEVL